MGIIVTLIACHNISRAFSNFSRLLAFQLGAIHGSLVEGSLRVRLENIQCRMLIWNPASVSYVKVFAL
jgi:hypothetical protein